jgi:hypothetical protein
MVVCYCGKKIKYFIVIVADVQTSLNPSDRLIIHKSFFVCDVCAERIIKKWEDHNKGRNEPHLIRKVEVNVIANTKKEFIRRASPQLFSQFSKMNWWLPKIDIKEATRDLKKV